MKVSIIVISLIIVINCVSNEEVVNEKSITIFDYVPNKENALDLKDGTLMEYETRFIWQKCSLGQNNDKECSGEPIVFNSLH